MKTPEERLANIRKVVDAYNRGVYEEVPEPDPDMPDPAIGVIYLIERLLNDE